MNKHIKVQNFSVEQNFKKPKKLKLPLKICFDFFYMVQSHSWTNLYRKTYYLNKKVVCRHKRFSQRIKVLLTGKNTLNRIKTHIDRLILFNKIYAFDHLYKRNIYNLDHHKIEILS